jgi:hypothetical protein
MVIEKTLKAEADRSLIDLTQSQYLGHSEIEQTRSDNPRRPGFNSTRQVPSNYMSIPMQPGPIYTGGGIMDSSGLGGETRDSVIQMYN